MKKRAIDQTIKYIEQECDEDVFVWEIVPNCGYTQVVQDGKDIVEEFAKYYGVSNEQAGKILEPYTNLGIEQFGKKSLIAALKSMKEGGKK